MGNGAAFHIDDVFAQAELLGDRERHRRKGLVDFDALYVRELPSGALQRFAYRRHRAETERAGFNRCDAVSDQTSHWFDRSSLREGAIGDNHRGSAAVEPRRVAGRDGSAFAEGRTKLGGPRRFVDRERFVAVLAPRGPVKRRVDKREQSLEQQFRAD
jgi:S-adenosylmethionine:diacylglycerol 3-amino-3-carboxypropyl transferase